jgi:hypothetical protein
MSETEEYLKEFHEVETKRKTLHFFVDRLDFGFVVYLNFFLILKNFYFREPINSNLIFQLTFTVVIPVILWFLYIKRYKIGWFLRGLFYSMLFIILSLNLLRKDYQKWLILHLTIVLLICGAIVVTSFFKRTIRKLRIESKVIILFSVIVLLLSLVFAYSVLIYKK